MQKKRSKPPSETTEQRIQWIPFELEALKEPASQACPPAGHMSDRYEVCFMQTSPLVVLFYCRSCPSMTSPP